MPEHTDELAALPDDEFERLGRQAGAELRTPPPADVDKIVQRAASRRRARMATIVAGAAIAVVATGLVAVDRSPDAGERNEEVSTAPDVTTAPPVITVPTTPGAWRTVADSPLALQVPVSAVWTGNEAILLGLAEADAQVLSAVAYDVSLDRWRQLADPPAALDEAVTTRWTGSEVLAASSQGEVFAYDPLEDRWTVRASADESMSVDASGAGVAVSAQGVLTRSDEGWWWYDNESDQWESVSEPELGVDYDMIAALGQDTMVATQIDGSTITSAVLDTETLTWRDGPSVEGPPAPRDPTLCSAVDELLVCFAEGYMSLEGAVIDPLTGTSKPFSLGNHSSALNIEDLPWWTHAWALLSPRSEPTWEPLPTLGDVDTFGAAVWTGGEIVFFGGGSTSSGQVGAGEGVVNPAEAPYGTTAAYTPLVAPGP